MGWLKEMLHKSSIYKMLFLTQLSYIIKSLFRRAEIDHAVVFFLSSRALQMLTGLIALLLIARYFTPQVQGYYYTFASVIALQSFVELGLCVVIINVASHEWALLSLDKDGHIAGKPEAFSRLVSLGRFVFKWYSAASVVFVIGVSIAGYIFFSSSNQYDIKWQAPWISLVLVTGLTLLSTPFTSLLEGCNQVAVVNKFRIYQVGFGSLALCLTIYFGGGLWAAVTLAGSNLLCNLYLQLIRYRNFFKPFFAHPVSSTINWRLEIWPMQWRLGLAGVVNYFAFSLFNPVMFHYHGSIVAGQMGMTWQVLGALQGIALAWVYTKVPRYGIFIAQKDYVGLDRLWFRCSLMSLIVMCVGSGALWLLVFGLNILQIPLSQRLLSPLPTGLFLIAFILMSIAQNQIAYLRAHKQEPILALSVTSSLLIGILVWILGIRFGPIGAAASYMSVALLVVVWGTYIFLKCRTIWHGQNPQMEPI